MSLGKGDLSCLLTGEFLHTRENVAISGSVAPDFSSFNFRIALSRASLDKPLAFPSGLTITGAHLDMDLSISRTVAENQGVLVNGGINLDSIDLVLPGALPVSNISGYITVQNNTIACNELSVRFLGRTGVLSGSAGSIFDPQLNLRLFIDSVNLADQTIAGKLPAPLSGQVSGTITCMGKPDSLTVTADLSSSQISLGQATLTNPLIKASLKSNAIVFDQIKAALLGGSINAQGTYSFNPDSGLALSFLAQDIDIIRAAEKNKDGTIRSSRFSIKGDFNKNRDGPNYSILGKGTITRFPNLGALTAEIQSNGTNILIKLSDVDRIATMQGFINNAYSKGLFKKKPDVMVSLRAKNLHPWHFSGERRKTREDKPGDLSFALSSELKGDASLLSLTGRLRINGALLSGPVSFNGTVKNFLTNPDLTAVCTSDSLTIMGILGPLSCHIERKNNRLSASSFSFTPSVHGQFSDNGGILDGGLIFDNWNLSAYINRDTEIARLLNLGGIVNGSLSLHGTKMNPSLAIKGSLINGRLGKLTGLTARIQASGNANRFSFSELTVENQERRFLFADNFTMTKEGITGKVKIDRLNLGSILGPSLGLRGLVFVNFDCSAAGKSQLTAAIDSFSYKNFSLSYFKADMYESNGTANIKVFSFGNGNISCEASGFFPFPFSSAFDKSSDSVNVLIQLKGDILKEVAQQTSLFKNKFGSRTQGRGIGKLHLVGRTGALTLENGFFEIGVDGKAAVFPAYIFPDEISKFKLYAGINNSVTSLDIEGTIQGKDLKITNEPAGQNEKSLVISVVNLDLGVLKLTTSEGGVALNVPGIIPAGEYGEFEFLDKNGSPGLKITGPINHPRIIGKMRVHNTRFTFPMLIDIAAAEGSGGKDFIDWDCTIMAGKNLRYYYNHRRTSPLPFIGKVLPKNIKDQIDRGVYTLITYPFCELTLDRSSWLHLAGMPGHKDFKVSGKISSRQGTVHYAGLNFTQDIEAGVEFDEQNNIPILWGSATTILRTANKSDFGKEITVTLYMRDPKTGVEYKRGKFNEFRMVPSSNMTINDDGELVDAETDAYQEMFGKNPEKSAKDLAMTEGKAMFGNLLSRYVSNYLERKILAFGRTNINPLLGFNATPDVMRFQIESDRFFNYIDMSLWTMEQFRKDLIQNMEFITGKYFFGGSVFFNYSSQVDLNENNQGFEVERLHHRLGLELTPWRYLYFNMDYEIGGLSGVIGDGFNARDFRSNIRLRIPLTKVFNIFIPEEEKK